MLTISSKNQGFNSEKTTILSIKKTIKIRFFSFFKYLGISKYKVNETGIINVITKQVVYI